LSLKDTPCTHIYLFGSCGSTGDAAVGTPVLLRKSLNLESFTGMLNRAEPDVCYPDESLYNEIRSFGIMPSLTALDGAAVSSLVLEEDYLAWFLQHAVSCVDMESSIIFSAAEHIGRKAAALLYVTDVLAKKPFYAPLPAEDRTTLRRAQKDLAEFLCRFIIHAGN
jgi:purine-nucleoside phosphorylase